MVTPPNILSVCLLLKSKIYCHRSIWHYAPVPIQRFPQPTGRLRAHPSSSLCQTAPSPYVSVLSNFSSQSSFISPPVSKPPSPPILVALSSPSTPQHNPSPARRTPSFHLLKCIRWSQVKVYIYSTF